MYEIEKQTKHILLKLATLRGYLEYLEDLLTVKLCRGCSKQCSTCIINDTLREILEFKNGKGKQLYNQLLQLLKHVKEGG